MAAAVVPMVAVEPVSLNSATDTSPHASGLARTSGPAEEDTRVPCLPRGSWSTAITRVLVSVDNVAALAEAMLVPAISGAAISDRRLNPVCFSVADSDPLPTSSMSGSFQCPGPA